ncbi:DNA-binding protein [uncultured Methanobrevibacter sp.]|uniref:DNA-binding protein n=1 Tax=uncultured Methanobrevibacter sp. TaxID=253161 RepID=UPI0025E736ED|nr:DNA-binding protein [uncultured Methanobrevibacter sp.]
MSELEDIRRKKMEELQKQQALANEQMQQQVEQQAQQEQLEAQLNQAVKQIMTPEARSRLANLKLTRPELVQQIEIQLIQSAQAGSLKGKVTDDQLKVLLSQLAGQKREMRITRK